VERDVSETAAHQKELHNGRFWRAWLITEEITKLQGLNAVPFKVMQCGGGADVVLVHTHITMNEYPREIDMQRLHRY